MFSNTFILIHFNNGFYFLFTEATNKEKTDNWGIWIKTHLYQSDLLKHQRSPVVLQLHHRFKSSKLIQQTCTHAVMKYITRKKKKGWLWQPLRHFSIFCWQDLDHNPSEQTTEPRAVHQEHAEWWGQVILYSHASCLQHNAQPLRQHNLWPFLQATS